MASKAFSARVMRFRRGVYLSRGRITPGCQVLLLRLSEDMSARAIVSIPRSRLAEEFECAPARITEWINAAKDAGFLSVVRRARPGTTAVYQGLVVVPEVREGVPLLEVRKTEPHKGTRGRTSNRGLEVRESSTPRVCRERDVSRVPQDSDEERSNEETCGHCGDHECAVCGATG